MAVKIYNVGVSNIKIREQGVFTTPELITDAGVFFEEAGGYYAGGNVIVDNKEYAIIVAPKELGESPTTLRWKTSNTDNSGGFSTFNGKLNMDSIINSGITNHPAAQYCADLNINGFNDWHLPSPDELEVCYRFLKPTTDDNETRERSLHNEDNGFNPNSEPTGSSYTINTPTQTLASEFIEGGSQAFESNAYWSSMEYSEQTSLSWLTIFSDGYQNLSSKTNLLYVRAVRWMEV